MTCETIHKEGKERFCPECGKKLFDELTEKMNKELLPKLINSGSYWFQYGYGSISTVVDIYEFFDKNNIKIPNKILFELDDNGFSNKFLSEDEYHNKYPEHKMYANKLSYNVCVPVLHIPWIRIIPTTNVFNQIKRLEEKYDIPLPDKIYDATFNNELLEIEKIFERNKNNSVVKEYLLSVIKKM